MNQPSTAKSEKKSMLDRDTELILTIVVTVVSGKASLHRCLSVLYPQANFLNAEIIIPFDEWSKDVGELAAEFPDANFHYIDDLGRAASTKISARQHRLYDRRRAVGLKMARGRIVAMTEDHAVPAEDWCQQILAAMNEYSYPAIGGAIENAVDRPLNWTWYYCDFGRYGRPFENGEAEYISDVNVAYKRDALESVQAVWSEEYHETTLHWAMQKRGMNLFLNKNMVVYQQRPTLSLKDALLERITWGRIFAETRANACSSGQRLLFAAGTIILPALLLTRVVKNMFRQKRTLRQMITVLPLAFLLLSGWSFGELLGYIVAEPPAQADDIKSTTQNVLISDRQ